MQTKKIISTMLAVLMLGNVSSNLIFANDQNAETMDALRQDTYFKTAVDDIAGLRLSVLDFRKQLQALDQKNKDHNKGQLDNQYRAARDEMVKVIQNLDVSTAKIGRLLKQLYAFKTQLQEELNLLEETKENLMVGRQYLNQLLLLVYKMQREIYTFDGEKVDDLKLFMKGKSSSQLLVGNDTLQALLLQINDLLQQATRQEADKTKIIRKLLELKTSAQKALEDYQTEIQTLQQKKEYLSAFMQMYKEKKLQQLSQEGKSAEMKLIDEEVAKLIKPLVSKKDKSGLPFAEQLQALEDQKDSSEKETSALAWPAYPVYQILRIFKDPDFEKEFGFKNLGVQMAIDQSTPVYAMRDGVVYAVRNQGLGVHWLMIVHTNGYVTVYQYLNEIAVQEGDVVRRGQFIAKSGGESGTQGAGFLATSPNLTFQVYKDGIAIDPLTVLDLSVVVDKDQVLPEEYRLKYFNDQYVRPIDVSDLALIKGETLDQRAQTFLNSYAVGVYRDLAFWDQVVAGTNIDRDMVMCIGFAESTLGKFLSTSNNIGNVGNNDRGDRIAYENPYNGARLIPLTLNNQYLGHYHTIKQLSRYGNQEGKIYASSPINWQSNVQKCLSKIKGYYVPEDFPFRTGINPSQTEKKADFSSEKSQIMSGSVQTKLGGIAL